MTHKRVTKRERGKELKGRGHGEGTQGGGEGKDTSVADPLLEAPPRPTNAPSLPTSYQKEGMRTSLEGIVLLPEGGHEDERGGDCLGASPQPPAHPALLQPPLLYPLHRTPALALLFSPTNQLPEGGHEDERGGDCLGASPQPPAHPALLQPPLLYPLHRTPALALLPSPTNQLPEGGHEDEFGGDCLGASPQPPAHPAAAIPLLSEGGHENKRGGDYISPPSQPPSHPAAADRKFFFQAARREIETGGGCGSSPSSHPIEVEGSKHKLTSKLGPYGQRHVLHVSIHAWTSHNPIAPACCPSQPHPTHLTPLPPFPSEVEGLKRKLTSKLGPSVSILPVPDWQVGECSAVWWRPNFETLMYPYCPPHITKPKVGNEKLFVDPLTERLYFGVPKNLKEMKKLFVVWSSLHKAPVLWSSQEPQPKLPFQRTPLHSRPLLSTTLHPSSLPSLQEMKKLFVVPLTEMQYFGEMKELFVVPLTERQYLGEMKKLFVVPLTERQYFGVPKNLRPLIQLTPRHSPSLLSNPLHSSPPLFTPRHSSLQQEMKKLFVVPLTERQYFGVPKNLKLLAVPLLELYDNVQQQNSVFVVPLTCKTSQAAGGGAAAGAL
ncbi:unnamed protein product [Closterium sp. NIES-64]|nr:unnamed protein product [Closterium sp. NIES-64]